VDERTLIASLRDCLLRWHAMTPRELTDLAQQVCTALEGRLDRGVEADPPPDVGPLVEALAELTSWAQRRRDGLPRQLPRTSQAPTPRARHESPTICMPIVGTAPAPTLFAGSKRR
jgi:hypothetical protein